MKATQPTRALLLASATVLAAALATAPTSAAIVRPPSGAPLTMGPEETVRAYTTTTGEGSTTPFPVAVSDGTGVVTAVWSEDGLRTAQRDPTGHWSDPVPVGTCRTDVQHCSNGGYALGVDAAGTVTLVWDQLVFDGTTFRDTIFVSSLPSAGAWSDPQQLGPTHRGFSSPSLAVARNGAVLVAYDVWLDARRQATRTAYRAPGVPWSAARWHRFRNAKQPQVGLSDSGIGVLVVRDTRPSDRHIAAYRVRRSATWGHATRIGLSASLDIPPYSLSVDGAGRAVVAWSHGRGFVMQARTMNRRGGWGAVRTLSPPDSALSEVPLAAMHRTPEVVWSTRHHAIKWATSRPAGRWRVRSAYPAGTGEALALVPGPGGVGLLWQHWTGVPELYAGLHTAAVGWTSGQRVAAEFDDPSAYGSVAMLPDGSLVVLSQSVRYTTPPAAQVSVIARRLSPAS